MLNSLEEGYEVAGENRQDSLLDERLRGCLDTQDILGEQGLLKPLQKRLIERALEGELTVQGPVTRRRFPKAEAAATAVTAVAGRRSKPALAGLKSKRPAIATAASSEEARYARGKSRKT